MTPCNLLISVVSSWVVLSPNMCLSKEIAVAGLFQVKQTLNGECDDDRTHIPSVMSLEAVKWTFQKLHDSGDIPSIKLVPYKTCGLATKAAEETIKILSDRKQDDLVVGIIGPKFSQEAKTVSEIISALPEEEQIAQVSFSATASLLGDKNRFPNFFRVIPNDDVQVRTMVELLKKLEWNRIAVLHDNDLYGLEIVRSLITMAKTEGICIPNTYEISSDTTQNREVLTDLLNGAHPNFEGIIYVGRPDVGHLFLELMETSVYTNTPALILCEAMELQLKAFSGLNGNVFDKSKGSYVVSPEFAEVTEFTTYWKDLFMNHSRLVDQGVTNPWLLDIYYENFGCRLGATFNCTIPSQARVDMVFLEQTLYVRYAIIAAYTVAASIKKLIYDKCESALPCNEFLDQISAHDFLNVIADTNVTLGDYFHFTPNSLHGEKIFFSTNSTFYEQNDRKAYTVYNLQSNSGSFQFVKIADFNGTFLTLYKTQIKDYEYDATLKTVQELSWPNIRRAQCPSGSFCQECITQSVEEEFIFIEGDLYILALVPYRQSDSRLGCGNPTESNLNGYGNTVAIQKAIRDSNELEQFGTLRVGLVIFDSCSNPAYSDWRIKNTLKAGIKLKNSSTIHITEKILGVVASYFSSVSVAISPTLTSLKILHLAYGATSEALSNRVNHRYFTRVATPDNKQADAAVKILKQIGINYIQLIYSDDAYGIGFRDAFTKAAEDKNICIDNKITLDPESSSKINTIYELLRTKPHARLVVVFTSAFVNELLKHLTTRMNPGEFLFLGSESWGINDDILKLSNSNKLVGCITINLELPDMFGVESSMKKIDVGFNEKYQNPWTEEYLQDTMQCHFNTSFDKRLRTTCKQSFESFWEENNLKISNWGNFAYLGTQALLNSSGAIFRAKCGTGPVVCDDYREGIDDLIDDMIRNSIITINGQQSSVFDSNGDGNIGYVIYNIQKSGDALYYTEIGRYSSDGNFALNVSKMVYPSGERFRSDCPNEKVCLECLPQVSRPPDHKASSPPISAIVLGSLFGITLLVLLATLVIVYVQHRRVEELRQTGDGYLTPTDVTCKYSNDAYTNTILPDEIPDSSTDDRC